MRKLVLSFALIFLTTIQSVWSQYTTYTPAMIGTIGGSNADMLFWHKNSSLSGTNGAAAGSWSDATGTNHAFYSTTSDKVYTFLNPNNDLASSPYDQVANTSISSGYEAQLGTLSYTIDFWANPSAATNDDASNTSPNITSPVGTPSSPRRYIFMPVVTSSATTYSLAIAVGNNGVFLYARNQNNTYCIGRYAFANTALHHYSIMYTQSNKMLTLYVDGSGTASCSFTLTGVTALYPSLTLGNCYQGLLDEVRMWKTTMNPPFMYSGNGSGLVYNSPDLVHRWTMDMCWYDYGYAEIMDEAKPVSGYTLSKLRLTNGDASRFNILGASSHSNVSLLITSPVYATNSLAFPRASVAVNMNNATSSAPGRGCYFMSPDNAINLQGPYASRSYYFAFQPLSVTGRQVIYKEGTVLDGIVIYLEGSTLYTCIYSTTNGWGPYYSSTSGITANQSYVLALRFDASSAIAELNGTAMAAFNGTPGNLATHSGPIMLGCSKGGARFHNGIDYNDNNFFNGYIFEAIAYKKAHNATERRLIANYLDVKLDANIAVDNYNYESTHAQLFCGIGRMSATDNVLSTTADPMVVSVPSLANNGDFITMAHDGGSTSSYATAYVNAGVNTPINVSRVLRTWKITSNNTTPVNIKIPGVLFPNGGPLQFQRAVLLILPDPGTDFTQAKVIAANSYNLGYFEFNNINIDNGTAVLSYGILNLNEFASVYNTQQAAMGKAHVNYTQSSISLTGVTVDNPSSMDIGDYLVIGSKADASNTTLPNNVPTMTRNANIYRVNHYGDIGLVDVGIAPAALSLPALGANQYYVLLTDTDTDFSNATVTGMVSSGSYFKAFQKSLPHGSYFCFGVATRTVPNPVALTGCVMQESNLDLTHGSTCKLTIQDDANFPLSSQCPEKINKSWLHVRFSTGVDNKAGDATFSASVNVTVNGYASANGSGTALKTYSMTLAINQDQPELLDFRDITDDYATIKSYVIQVTSFTNTTAFPQITNSYRLTAEVKEEKTIGVVYATSAGTKSLDYNSNSSTGGLYTFTWDADQCNVGSYQFQLLRLYNVQDNSTNPGVSTHTSNENDIITEIDWNKALTLETVNKNITLTLAEGTGYYMWRVRPIGNQYPNGVADSRNWGNWSTDNMNFASPMGISACTTKTCSNSIYGSHLVWYQQFDRDKNFIFQRSFTENSEVQESISYANGLEQIKQQQVRVRSNNGNNIVVNQTQYDYSGRSGIVSAPTPVNNTTEFDYQEMFLQNSGSLYTASHFDTDNNFTAPLPVTGGSAATYYSSANSEEVPDAEGYVFGRTIYETDGTNRVKEQSSLGSTHTIGSGHTVRVSFGSVTDAELIRIFGDEAPAASSVYKQVTTDQDNTSAINYIDIDGNTIATCISKNGLTTNLETLPNDASDQNPLIIKGVIGPNTHSGNTTKANAILTITENQTDVTFKYDLTVADATASCGFCMTCGYNIQIKIIDLQTNTVIKNIIKNIPAGSLGSAGSCNPTSVPVNINDGTGGGNDLVIRLDAGRYAIEKIITVDETGATSFVSQIAQASETQMTTVLAGVQSALNTGNSDNEKFANYLAALKSLVSTYAASPSSVVYTTEITDPNGVLLYSLLDYVMVGTTKQYITTNDTYNPSMMVKGTQVIVHTSCCSVTLQVLQPEYTPCNDPSIVDLGDNDLIAGAIMSQVGSLIPAGTDISIITGRSSTDVRHILTNMLSEPDNLYPCDKVYACYYGMVTNWAADHTTPPPPPPANISIAGDPNYTDVAGNLDYTGNSLLNHNPPPAYTRNYFEDFLDCVGRNYKGFVGSTGDNLYKYKPYMYFVKTNPTAPHICENAFCSGPDISTPVLPDPYAQGITPCSSTMCSLVYYNHDNTPTGVTGITSTYYTLRANSIEVTSIPSYNSLYQCIKGYGTTQSIMGVTYPATFAPNQTQIIADANTQAARLEAECLEACKAKYDVVLAAVKRYYDQDGNGVYGGRGLNLLANGSFSMSFLSAWTYASGSSIVNGAFNINKDATPALTFTAGKVYKVKFKVIPVPQGSGIATEPTGIVVRQISSRVIPIPGGTDLYVADETGGSYEFTFTATSAAPYIGFTCSNPFILDDVEIYEVINDPNFSTDKLCCTAQALIDDCSTLCNIDVVLGDCNGSPYLLSIGTPEQLSNVNGILYGTVDLKPKTAGTSCDAGYHDLLSYNKINLTCGPTNGSVIWDKTFGTVNNDQQYNPIELSDGNYLVYTSDNHLIKFNKTSGSIIWSISTGNISTMYTMEKLIIEDASGNIYTLEDNYIRKYSSSGSLLSSVSTGVNGVGISLQNIDSRYFLIHMMLPAISPVNKLLIYDSNLNVITKTIDCNISYYSPNNDIRTGDLVVLPSKDILHFLNNGISDGLNVYHYDQNLNLIGSDYKNPTSVDYVATYGTALGPIRIPLKSISDGSNTYVAFLPQSHGGTGVALNDKFIVAKVNSSGTIVWIKTQTVVPSNVIFHLAVTSNHDLLLTYDSYTLPAGTTNIIKFKGADGTLSSDSYHASYAGISSIEIKNNIVYVLGAGSQPIPNPGGSTVNPNGGTDLWVMALDENLNLLRQDLIGGTNDDVIWSAVENNPLLITSDNYFVLAGNSSSGIGGDKSQANIGNMDNWLVKYSLGAANCNTDPLCVAWIGDDNHTVNDPTWTQIAPTPLSNPATVTQAINAQLAQCRLNNEEQLRTDYISQCTSSDLKDNLTYEYTVHYYHYTLYYYDRAGRLSKTVPPAGVRTLDITQANVMNRTVPTAHKMITRYWYNSLGQLIRQQTPDGGINYIIYNNLGQARYSQNAKQLQNGYFTYIKYDYLGRIIETGESSIVPGSLNAFLALENNITDLNSNESNSYPTTGNREQIYSIYSEEVSQLNYLGQGQLNIRNRLSYSYKLTGTEKSYTAYSYDAFGNVKWTVQGIPGLSNQTIGYEYDLVNNKVLLLKYNEQHVDQFFHRYTYDADNRLIAVYTSKDKNHWIEDKDAAYQYFAHGSLKRTELGEDHIQGLDYVYTINGWIKGVNSPTLDKTLDPGQDGNIGNHSVFAEDEYSMVLGYFLGDYKHYGSIYNNTATGTGLYPSTTKNLYGGNIAYWVSRVQQEYRDYIIGIQSPTTSDYERHTNIQMYTYDQLNRITSSKYSYYSAGAYNANNEKVFNTSYTYDANGNIKTLNRNGNQLGNGSGTPSSDVATMDQLSYVYDGSGENNKLLYITDAVGSAYAARYTTDIENQTTANYYYDEIGNLTRDESEKITISWNVYGKIERVLPDYNSANQRKEQKYIYDASGNRIRKEINAVPYNGSGVYQRLPENLTTTYYVRDATGNVMAIYERTNTPIAGEPGYYTANYTIIEIPLYGSSRIGEYKPNQLVAQKKFYQTDVDNINFSDNVLAKGKALSNWAHNTVNVDPFLNTPVFNTKTSQYSISSDIYVVNQVLNSGIGEPAQVVIEEDENGNLLFFAIAYRNYWNMTNSPSTAKECLLIYDKNGQLMPAQAVSSIKPDAELSSFRDPKDKNKYYIVYLNQSNQVTRRIIDMSAAGNGTTGAPTGVALNDDGYNFGFSNPSYAYHIIEDRAKCKVELYALTYPTPVNSSGVKTMQLIRIEIGSGGTVLTPSTVAGTIPAKQLGETGEMSISADGKQMALIAYEQKQGWYDHMIEKVYVYDIGYDYNLALNALATQKVYTLPEYSRQGMSLEWSEDGRFIYVTRDVLAKQNSTGGSEKIFWRIDLRDNIQEQLSLVVGGDVRRGTDGRIYVANVKTGAIEAWDEQPNTGAALQVTTKNVNVATGSDLNAGYLPLQKLRYLSNEIASAQLGRIVHQKSYELVDHLGNITVVVSDRLKSVSPAGGGNTFTTRAEVLSYTNYYAFGMAMPGRNSSSSLYRYGYNGKELDKDIGNAAYDYGLRIYDARIAKFLSVDPLANKYPELTPYQFASNTPIMAIDLDGEERMVIVRKQSKNGTWKTQVFIFTNNYNTHKIDEKSAWAVSHDHNYKVYGDEVKPMERSGMKEVFKRAKDNMFKFGNVDKFNAHIYDDEAQKTTNTECKQGFEEYDKNTKGGTVPNGVLIITLDRNGNYSYDYTSEFDLDPYVPNYAGGPVDTDIMEEWGGPFRIGCKGEWHIEAELGVSVKFGFKFSEHGSVDNVKVDECNFEFDYTGETDFKVGAEFEGDLRSGGKFKANGEVSKEGLDGDATVE